MDFSPFIIHQNHGTISLLEMKDWEIMSQKLIFCCPFLLKSYHPKIKQQKIATYLQLQYHLGQPFKGIEKNSLGQPFLTNLEEINFSISHSDFLHVIFFSKKNIKNGIDVININARAEKVKNKFLSPQEINLCEKNNNFNLAFGAKEACFKKIGGGIHLKTDLLLEQITEKEIYVKYIKKNNKIKLNYLNYKDFFYHLDNKLGKLKKRK